MNDLIRTEEELDERLTRPSAALVEFVPQISSPLLLLGAGGKMGPTLAVLARRAAEAAKHPLEIIAASRYSNKAARKWLEESGIRTCEVDLLSRDSVAGLPESSNIIYLAGMKFGTTENPALTWALNTLAPAHVSERYPSARIVALSTGNVYPLVPVRSSGAKETQALTPLGEYPNAAVARERLFQYFSQRNKTPVTLMRLNYAVELRYGVLVDIARKVWAGESIDVSNSAINCIWQGDANELILRSLALAAAPASVWNLTGPVLNVRKVAKRFGELFEKAPTFAGEEADTALLSNAAKLNAALGEPRISADTMISWIAHWITAGGRSLNKPTHFEVRTGTY